MAELLTLDGLAAGYGSALVLNDVSANVAEGEIAVIMGANGVGKTTTLRTTMGLLRPWRGTIHLDGLRLDGLSPERVVRAGVGVVPEPPAVFTDLSVADNLRVGGFALGASRRAVEQRVDRLLDEFPKLEQRHNQRAGSLSGGERRVLALARALMGSPRLLLVDEASMGLFPSMVTEVMTLLGRLRDQGLTVLMVEQNVAALRVADHAYVMEKGQIVHEARGDLRALRDEVSRIYLGSNTNRGAA